MKPSRLALLCICALALAGAVSALTLPDNIIRAQQETLFAASQISFLVAFLAGFLSFISPCTWPALAPFFAFGFKEKRRIVRMTLVFFAGFTIIFALMGLLASVFGDFFTPFRSELALAAGGLLIIIGVYTVLGQGFSLVRFNHTFGNDPLGVFLMGMAFAVGFTPCVGPILAGVLILAATAAKVKAVVLMLAYSLGIFSPLLLLAVAWDRMGWFRKAAAKEVTLFGKPRSLAHLIAGGLLIMVGLVYILLRNTSFANTWDVAQLKLWWFSVQEFMVGSSWAVLAGAVVLAVVALVVLTHLRNEKRSIQ